jgi:hypothetical protein
MKTLCAILVSSCLFGCATNPALMRQVKRAEIQHVAQFNHLRRQNMPVPEIEFVSMEDYAEVNHLGPIQIDPDKCAADLNDCLNDTIPHELAHWALYYYGYYTPTQVATQHGVQRGEAELPHDAIWCDTMRAFGGDPAKHGYCH